MSSFICEHCGAEIIDTENGYITECEHYPLKESKVAQHTIIAYPKIRFDAENYGAIIVRGYQRRKRENKMSKLEQRFNRAYEKLYQAIKARLLEDLTKEAKSDTPDDVAEVNLGGQRMKRDLCDHEPSEQEMSAMKCKMCNTLLSETNSLPSAISYCSAENPFKDGIIRFSGDPLCIDCLIELANWWGKEAIKLFGNEES